MHAGIPTHPPWDQTPPGADPPPGSPCGVHAGRYGEQAGGTHPTGMRSCFTMLFCSLTPPAVHNINRRIEVYVFNGLMFNRLTPAG